MLKKVSKLGIELTKSQQKVIIGGTLYPQYECPYGFCEDFINGGCYSCPE